MFDYSPTADLLKNRTLLITGAGQGVGKSLALSCAKLGAQLILLSRTKQHLTALSQQLMTQGYKAPLLIPFDLAVATPSDYTKLALQLKAAYPQLDGLVHASIALPLKPIADTTALEFQQVMHVNVNAVFSLTHHLLPLLSSSPDASIILTSSSVGRKGRAQWGAYATSKFATEGFMQCLADELKHTAIRVNSINPGATQTEMRALVYPQEDPSKLATAEAIMPVYLYLLGPDSKGVTGQALSAQ